MSDQTAKNPVQLIDIFKSRQNTMMTVWDGIEQRRRTIELSGDHVMALGAVFEYNAEATGKAPAFLPLSIHSNMEDLFPLRQTDTSHKPIDAEMVVRIF